MSNMTMYTPSTPSMQKSTSTLQRYCLLRHKYCDRVEKKVHRSVNNA